MLQNAKVTANGMYIECVELDWRWIRKLLYQTKTLQVLISEGFYRLFYGSHLYSSGRKAFDEQIATLSLFTLD